MTSPDRIASNQPRSKGQFSAAPADVRFFQMVVIPTDKNACWLWEGTTNSDGYGQFCKTPGRLTGPHRWSYEHFVGAIPKGLQIDHLCRVRRCVNPRHLEVVTPKENTRRAAAFGTIGKGHKKKTHCPKGHPYSDDNLKIIKHENGHYYRRCRACLKLAMIRWRANNVSEAEDYDALIKELADAKARIRELEAALK